MVCNLNIIPFIKYIVPGNRDLHLQPISGLVWSPIGRN